MLNKLALEKKFMIVLDVRRCLPSVGYQDMKIKAVDFPTLNEMI